MHAPPSGRSFASAQDAVDAAVRSMGSDVPDWLRRRTKPIVDSTVDSAAEGCAALLIVAVVTGGNIDAGVLARLLASRR